MVEYRQLRRMDPNYDVCGEEITVVPRRASDTSCLSLHHPRLLCNETRIEEVRLLSEVLGIPQGGGGGAVLQNVKSQGFA